VFPSVWYEARPGTTLEAAGSGLPIIVSNLSAAVEQVDDLGIGEIFEAGNPADLAEKMRPYIDTEFARRQGRETQVNCKRLDLSWDTHIAKLDKVYRDELALLSR
jgi:glycosyltransferase involved in cell wall biosynthesis